MTGIKEVANRAGVSMTTVSRFLGGDKNLSISSATKEKIRESVEFYHYVSKRVKRNTSLGIIITKTETDELADPYMRSIRVGILKEINEKGLKLKETFYMEDNISLKKISPLGAVLVVGSMTESFLIELHKYNPNIIVIDDPFHPPFVDSVNVDIQLATICNLEFLYQKGHRNIAFIGGKIYEYMKEENDKIRKYQDLRASAYEKWMKENNIENYKKEFLGEWSSSGGAEQARFLLKSYPENERPTAILVASDTIAIGVYRELKDNGINVPDDIAIISFDNSEVSSFLSPSLTSVDLQQDNIGAYAVKLAYERIFQERDFPLAVSIMPEIRQRESVKRIED